MTHKTKEVDTTALLNEAAAVLKEKGWNVVVIGGVSVEKRGTPKYNYSLVIDFTGSPPNEIVKEGDQ